MSSVALAATADWTEAEQRQLEALARQYPASSHSIVAQCAKIAAGLPNKSIRDVGARLRAIALDPLAASTTPTPAGDARHEALERQVLGTRVGFRVAATSRRRRGCRVDIPPRVVGTCRVWIFRGGSRGGVDSRGDATADTTHRRPRRMKHILNHHYTSGAQSTRKFSPRR